jgi:hypothetical protein
VASAAGEVQLEDLRMIRMAGHDCAPQPVCPADERARPGQRAEVPAAGDQDEVFVQLIEQPCVVARAEVTCDQSAPIPPVSSRTCHVLTVVMPVLRCHLGFTALLRRGRYARVGMP